MITAITIPIHTIPSVEPDVDTSGGMGVGVITCKGAAGPPSVAPLRAKPEIESSTANDPTNPTSSTRHPIRSRILVIVAVSIS